MCFKGDFMTLALLPEKTPIRWELRDPRYQEIKRGEASLNAFGSFDLSFELPDNINLGDASLVLHYENESHYHRFQVQEVWRRPLITDWSTIN